LFERFTERARQVVVLAQDEARALKHNYIGTEHILLGLLREEEGIAAAASARGLRLVFVDQAELEIAGARGATWSSRVLALAGVPSVAEAAALAAAGPRARLILPRIVVGPVTCVLASSEEGP